MDDTHKLLAERGSTHGDYDVHAGITQAIKEVYHNSPNYFSLPAHYKETLDMIAHKLGRILSGDPYHEDHLADTIGYATLSLDRVRIRNDQAPK